MRGHLFVPCLVIALTVFSQANACSTAPRTPEPTEEELFSQASAVFVAHLISTQEVAEADPDKKQQGVIEGTFRVLEILKGSPPANSKVRSWQFLPGNCTLPFISGGDYIFFLANNNDYITFVSGSAGPILNLNATEVQKQLNQLRALAKK